MNKSKTLVLKQFHEFSQEEQFKIIWRNFSTYPDYDWWNDMDVNDRVPEAKKQGFDFGKIKEFDLDRDNYIKINFDFSFDKFIDFILGRYPEVMQITSKRHFLWYYDGHVLESDNPYSYSKFDNRLPCILELEHCDETRRWKPTTIEKLDKAIKFINELAQEKLTNFCNEVLSQLRKEYEWLTSIESIADLCEANDYWFDSETLELTTPDEKNLLAPVVYTNPNIGNWFNNGFISTATFS